VNQRCRLLIAFLEVLSIELLSAHPTFATIVIDTVAVGNSGNGNDPLTGYGSVNYEFSIGQYEVTLGQYTTFLNAVAATDTYELYNTRLESDPHIAGIARGGVSGSYTYSVIGSPNKPVTYVDWGDALRFVNWLHNGQPTGPQTSATTEDGAYTLNGASARYTGSLSNISRKRDARWFLPSENEWYKAAYHKKDGATNNYWRYPTKSNDLPSSIPPSSTQTNAGNFNWALTGPYAQDPALNYLTAAGSYSQAPGPYGTYDQGGNIQEYIEAEDPNFPGTRFARGGEWQFFSYASGSAYRQGFDAYWKGGGGDSGFGFRVASILPPSPKTYAILVGSDAPGILQDGTLVPHAIRGDVDVDNVKAKLTWANETKIIKYNWDDADTAATDITSAVADFASKATAKDTLLFYYSGHGSGGSGILTDEAINPVNGGVVFDQALTSALADDRLRNVRKLILLDSCHSGGFWNDDIFFLDHDLSHLQNVALLAAATEDGFATTGPGGTGEWTNTILPFLNEDTTFAQLADFAATAHSGNVTGFFKDAGFGSVLWAPTSSYTEDFNPHAPLNNAVPEPNSCVFAGFGLIMIVAMASSRAKIKTSTKAGKCRLGNQ